MFFVNNHIIPLQESKNPTQNVILYIMDFTAENAENTERRRKSIKAMHNSSELILFVVE